MGNSLAPSAAGAKPPGFIPSGELREEQWVKLRRLLRFAYDRSPFYRERFRSIGARPEDIRTQADFLRFPVLTRQDVLDHADRMLTGPKDVLVQGHSGGSSGYPLTTYYSRGYERRRRAQKIMLDGWIGAKFLWPAFELWGPTKPGNVPGRLTRWHLVFQKHYRYRIVQVNQDILAKIARDFLAIKPTKVFGYASLLKSLAVFILESRTEIRGRAKAVISSSETLSDGDRLLMEEAYGGPVYNRYNSCENAGIASECRDRAGLHVHVDHIYMEILRDGRAARVGEPGNVVLTDLDNLAMPFIRYQNEDISAWSKAECPCGRPLPLLERVYGRETSFVFDENGGAYPGINMPDVEIYEMIRHGMIRQFQFRQRVKGRLEALFVRGRNWKEEDQMKISQMMQAHFHGAMRIEIKYVEAIPAQPSGKTPSVVSSLPYSCKETS